ncbi:EEF1A lysine methyltransferase 3 [Colius striatus]|uniref:EEF1A lysine methyltransferase 3 n=1 Tax=Colius striatus TaxID=57412 RepID=UPI002B1DAF0F|nr:EEF1A lysine methyltransferase 3 [Colius striatus]
MAAPRCHEEEEEGEGEGCGALRAVFPRDPALFADTFPVRCRYRFCGRVLRIAQHHGPRLGTAGFVWDAALALCRYMEAEQLDLRGQTVIELGAGTGIVGILAAMLGGDVTITDQPVALQQIRENVSLNFPAGAGPRVLPLRWGHDQTSFPPHFTFLLASDITYDPSSFPLLLRTLLHLRPRRALLSAKLRGGGDGDGGPSRCFFRRLLPMDFGVRLLWTEPEGDIEIYGVTPKERGDPQSSPSLGVG